MLRTVLPRREVKLRRRNSALRGAQVLSEGYQSFSAAMAESL